MLLLSCISLLGAADNFTKVSELIDDCSKTETLIQKYGEPVKKTESVLIWNIQVTVDVERRDLPKVGSIGYIAYYRVPCLVPGTTAMIGYTWKLKIEREIESGSFDP